jgi:DNA adenine methylase
MNPKKPRHSSPLRYPGGKAALASFLKTTIRLNNLDGCEYYEPYAGGAGAALELLFAGVVEKIHLNDADVRIHSFWRTILRNHTKLTERIASIPLNIEEWHKQHAIASAPKKHKQFDVGFATFYMNRCNRSGVITGAGPIGGYEQIGKYLLDVRFNRAGLIDRIEHIAKNRDFISFSNLDAIEFLKRKLPLGNARSNVFAFLDPPYVVKGQRLYLNAYEASDHRKLARYLHAQSAVNWVMSYDDCSLIRDLYEKMTVRRFRINYALQDKRIAKELLVAPKHVSTPASCKIHGRRTILTSV